MNLKENYLPGEQNGSGTNPEIDPEFESLAAANFSGWNEALQTNDPKQVADLYTEDATFLPTVSGEFKKGPTGAEEYFEHFLKKFPEGRITESVVQPIDDQHYLQSGKYDFEVGDPDNRTTLHARFTFLWQRDEQGNWKIAHHHSSLNPEQ